MFWSRKIYLNRYRQKIFHRPIHLIQDPQKLIPLKHNQLTSSQSNTDNVILHNKTILVNVCGLTPLSPFVDLTGLIALGIRDFVCDQKVPNRVYSKKIDLSLLFEGQNMLCCLIHLTNKNQLKSRSSSCFYFSVSKLPPTFCRVQPGMVKSGPSIKIVFL